MAQGVDCLTGKCKALSSTPSTAKTKKINRRYMLSTVVNTCHPTYLGGRDQEDCDLSLAQAKMFMRPHLNQ
jgi:ribosomal protein L31